MASYDVWFHVDSDLSSCLLRNEARALHGLIFQRFDTGLFGSCPEANGIAGLQSGGRNQSRF
jgi:hypothetical protein